MTPESRRPALRNAAAAILILGASLGVGLLARRYVTESSRFAVRSIEVAGQVHRTGEAIAAMSGITPGTNIFSVDLDRARASILADPWIADAALTRRLPGTLHICVTERRAAAIVAVGDLLLVTSDGEPFKRFESGDPVDLPVVTGLTAEEMADDREGARRTIEHAVDLALEYEEGALARRATLEEVHVDSSGAFTLLAGQVAVELVLGKPPFRRKLNEAVRVVAELDKRHAVAEAIMLDNEVRPERVVARLR